MIYNGKEIKKLGFGLMRLPMIESDVDIEQTKQMVDEFLKGGYTYFDTAYGYINGKSEEAIKVALVDRYPRESYQLATKLPAWAGAKDAEEARQMFYTSLKRTGAGYFDFYLLHNLGGGRTKFFYDYDLWEFAKQQKEKGLIKKLGFSMHDTADTLETILAKHHNDVDFVQLQINYADWEDKTIQSQKCLEVAAKYNKPVVVMEPIKGGVLANPPEQVVDILNSVGTGKSAASWALRFAASQDIVFTVLSGMSTIEQMQQNIETFNNFAPLDEQEYAAIARAQAVLKDIPSVPCTNCRYCVKDCPANIEIPIMLGALNTKLMFNNDVAAAGWAGFGRMLGGKAGDCVACGACESVCPQSIKIIDELKTAAQLFEANL